MRVLVVKLADIGDVLTATPALRALRTSLPAAHITMLATPNSAAALRGLPYLDEIVLFDKFRYDRPWDALRPRSLAAAWGFFRSLRAGCYDSVLILHHLTTRWGALKYAALALATGARQRAGLDNGRGWFLTQRVPDRGFGAVHEADYWLEVAGLLGAHTADRRIEIAVSDDDRQWAACSLSPTSPDARGPIPHTPYPTPASRPLIAIHPGSGSFMLARRWPPERFALVADELAGCYQAQIVLLGGPEEESLAQSVAEKMHHQPLNLAGQTSIKQLAALLARCALFVGGDSGVMHVAVAAGVPVVALFGPTNENAWGPYTPPGSGLRSVVVRAAGTQPVMYVGRSLGKDDAEAGQEAMAAITVEMVIAAAERMLSA